MMEKLLLQFGICFLVGASALAQAKPFNCLIDTDDAWASEESNSSSDTLTAEVDLAKGKVELYSLNNIFGPNPFAILTLKDIKSNGISKVYTFDGQNKSERGTRYRVSFETGTEHYLQTFTGRNSKPELKLMSCRQRK